MENFKLIMDKANWGMLIYTTTDGSVSYANNYARECLEAGADFSVFDLIAPAKRSHVRYLNNDILRSESFLPEVCLKKINGQFLYAELSTICVNTDEDSFAMLFKDITHELKLRRDLTVKQDEITKTYQDLLRQNEQLKELDKAKDRFIALISHELRTPLSAMISTSEVLKMGLVDSEEQAQEFNTTIYEQGQYLLEIVNDILDFAKIQSGRIDLYVEEANVVEFIEKLCMQFEQYAEDKGIKIISPKNDDPALCYFDENRLRQVVSNVLSNAIKFSPKNTNVYIELKEDDGSLFIMIKDEGPGIPADKADAIFDEFVTLENINSHQKGTGLGMPISRKLAELMGGQLNVDTSYTKGACMIIELPKTKILSNKVYREKPIDGEIDLSKIA